MSVLPVGMAGASASYSITNSARLNGTSDYLSKTLTTNTTTSGSIWVKRSKLGATSPIFDNKVYFTSGDALYAFGLTSTALYRDPSAWMHIFWNGTGVYVNGTHVTGSGSYTAASVTNPRLGYDGTNYFSGYMSDYAFWNGTSASLQGGATNTDGVWAAKRPSAGYSFLAFGSSGALGTDTSGNGNNWTVTGSPVQTTDTPTNNYCTINPLDGDLNGHTISSGNLSWSAPNGTYYYQSRCTIAVPTSGLWYWEATVGSTNADSSLGIVDITANAFSNGSTWFGNSGALLWRGRVDGSQYTNGTAGTSYSSFAVNDKMMFAFKPSNGHVWWGKNGTWYNSGDPANDTGYVATVSTSTVFAPFIGAGNAFSATFNFGATAFAYTPPTGFKSLCTANLTSTAVTTSGTFTGNANADGPFVWTNGNPATLTINGNAVTFGTHADKTAGGFKLRSSSASYNTSGSNTWTATAGKRFVYSATSINTAQGNP